MKNKKNNAFTLIELLVVIAIIALLMSIILPSLSAVKDQARKTVCMANLVQMGALFTLYADDNDDLFFTGYYHYTTPDGQVRQNTPHDTWPYVMQPYYENPDLKFCPAARSSHNRYYSQRSAWGQDTDEVFSGSYGLNGWICNPPEDIPESEGHKAKNFWRTMYPEYNRSQIPLMADAYWFTGLPENKDLPPEREDSMQPYELPFEIRLDHESDDSEPVIDADNQIRRFCTPRHRKELNVLFLDGSVRPTSPKKLWRLKWHREFDLNAPLPEWPEWMQLFKDPDDS